MRFANLPISTIRPLQLIGVSKEHLAMLRERMNWGLYLGSVTVIQYVDPPEKIENLLTDGTHRAYLHHQRGDNEVPADIIETDEDFARVNGGDLVRAYGSLDGFRTSYRDDLRPRLLAAGILDLADLPLVPGDRRALFDIPVLERE